MGEHFNVFIILVLIIIIIINTYMLYMTNLTINHLSKKINLEGFNVRNIVNDYAINHNIKNDSNSIINNVQHSNSINDGIQNIVESNILNNNQNRNNVLYTEGNLSNTSLSPLNVNLNSNDNYDYVSDAQFLIDDDYNEHLKKVMNEEVHIKDNACKQLSILKNIKNYYKKIAISNNDFKTEIKTIDDINLVTDDMDNIYCDVLYTLNNMNKGTRRFNITDNGDIIYMGKSGSGLTV
jgi:hypothetical protein